MGWELRRSRLDLYRNEWVDGRRVKVYLAKAGTPAAVLLEHGLTIWHERREAKRRASLELRARVGELLRTVIEANAELGSAAEAVLVACGFHRLNRGRWRMARKTLPATSSGESPDLPPGVGDAMIVYTAPENVPGATDLFARVRAGDKAAQSELRRWMRETDGQLDHYGDLAMRATGVIVGKITGGDPVWRIAAEEKVKAMTAELLGPSPTVLDRLLVRRVVNGWLAVHALEVESAVRPPRQMRDKANLEAAIGKASRRYERAISELASVRRMRIPPILVNVTPPTQPPPPRPRVAQAEVGETKVEVESAEGDAAADRRLPTAKKVKRGKGVKRSGRKAA